MDSVTVAAGRSELPAGPYLIVGLARSGAAVARLLAERGGEVIGCDEGSPPEAGRLTEAGVEVHLNEDGVGLLERVSVVIKSPGVPPHAPAVAAAERAGMPVLGEMEVAWRFLPNPFVAITGTNGKTTVAELIGHLLRGADRPVEVAGNVGTPLSAVVDSTDPEATVICEASSFQLHDSWAFAPEVAVFLNLATDHLDWHGTLSHYLASKLRIFANQEPGSYAICEADDPALAGVPIPGGAEVLHYGVDVGGGCRVRVDGDRIILDGEPLISADELALAGEHNLRNAMAAALAAAVVGVEPEAIARGLRDFAGIPHRLERVAEREGVLWVNDSKATNVAAAAAALTAFERPVRAILGGSLKGSDFGDLAASVAESCVAAYLIGEAAERLAADLEPAARAGVELTRCEDLAAAVGRAAREASTGDVVLLAPACASFDAFADYAERGDAFRALVAELE